MNSSRNTFNENLSDISSRQKVQPDVNFRIKAGLFLTSVTGLSALVAFGMTVASVKKKDPKMFHKGTMISNELEETGVQIAIRAFKWGSFYAIIGCSLVSYGIWKLSGAQTIEDFRYKIGSLLPRIPKNELPQSRTEFSGLSDLLKYLDEEYGQKSSPSKQN